MKEESRNIRLLRGRVRIKPDVINRVGSIIIPDTVSMQDERNRKLARTGVVMQVGAPALTRKRGHEVPMGFQPGDRVVYIFGQLSSNGHDAWCAQDEVLGVVE